MEFKDDGVPAYVYSNGALEWALEHGYDVYVLTPQPDLRKEDDWWQALLRSPDRIFKGLASAETPQELFHPWTELLRRLNIPFERIQHTGEAKDLLRKNGVLFAEDIQAMRDA
jgi:hypothetical protein